LVRDRSRDSGTGSVKTYAPAPGYAAAHSVLGHEKSATVWPLIFIPQQEASAIYDVI